jgi:hypothetical protein
VRRPGYLSVDLGQRTFLSAGCGVMPEDRVLSSRAEGLDALVLADDPLGTAVADASTTRPTTGGLLVLRGASSSSARLGPHTRISSPAPRQRPTIPAGDRSGIVEIESARQSDGLLERADFDHLKPDPSALPGGVSALRVLDAQHPEHFNQLLDDWLALLRSGRRVTATGASASRSIHGNPPGYPRTYVAVPPAAAAGQTAQQLLAALRAGRAVVSTGPFVELRVGDKGPGEIAALPRERRRRRRRRPRRVKVSVVVHASPTISVDTLALYVGGGLHNEPEKIAFGQVGEPFTKTYTLEVTGDTFVVALVRGSEGLAPLVKGRAAEALPAVALTNPVWIDTDGNGHYDPPE